MRRTLASLLLLALAPLPSSAEETCNDISFYSGYRLAGITSTSWDATGWVGCGTGDDTNYILPGSSFGEVLIEREAPVDGELVDGELVGSWAHVRLAGSWPWGWAMPPVPLTFTRQSGSDGSPRMLWISDAVEYGEVLSVQPGTTVFIRVCFAANDCQERTYHTAA